MGVKRYHPILALAALRVQACRVIGAELFMFLSGCGWFYDNAGHVTCRFVYDQAWC